MSYPKCGRHRITTSNYTAHAGCRVERFGFCFTDVAVTESKQHIKARLRHFSVYVKNIYCSTYTRALSVYHTASTSYAHEEHFVRTRYQVHDKHLIRTSTRRPLRVVRTRKASHKRNKNPL
eukprot:TRINITY_DN2162_c0_g1_i1.p1 TRINITY_DN2162_c0_g1~~TRINITY_DN2162_c0_g1_i1.p1  ORF type:complete len:121 (+),score=11.52 TRINITY_DN2162_c0_g1_i1:64-426(+)